MHENSNQEFTRWYDKLSVGYFELKLPTGDTQDLYCILCKSFIILYVIRPLGWPFLLCKCVLSFLVYYFNNDS